MARAKNEDLYKLLKTLNQEFGRPVEPYVKEENGTLKAQPGNFHFDNGMGGLILCEMSSEGGAVTCPWGHERRSKGDMYDMLHVILATLRVARKQANLLL